MQYNDKDCIRNSFHFTPYTIFIVMNITVEVEAKAKESAVKKLMKQLSGEKL
jgi:hypothetical protein